MNRYGRVPALNGVGVRRAAIPELLSAQIQSKSVLVAFLCYMIAMIEHVHVHNRNDSTCGCTQPVMLAISALERFAHLFVFFKLNACIQRKMKGQVSVPMEGVVIDTDTRTAATA